MLLGQGPRRLSVSKPELEFFPVVSMKWTPVAGNVSGLYERVLALDALSGVATRMLRFDPGTDTSANGIVIHDFWEEVYILEGSISDISLGKKFTAGMYACRPPGMKHGPWKTEEGCTTFEVRYHLRPAFFFCFVPSSRAASDGVLAMKLAVPDMISNSYFPALAAVELGFFKQQGFD